MNTAGFMQNQGLRPNPACTGSRITWSSIKTKDDNRLQAGLAPYAVCEYLGYKGPDVKLTDEVGKVIEHHDWVTKARSRLKLA